MKFKLTACLAAATFALASCGAEPQVEEQEMDPTFEGAEDTSSSMGAGALTDAAPEEAVRDIPEEYANERGNGITESE